MQRPQNLIPSAYDRLVKQYEAAGDDFHINTRPYYSTGAFRFERDGTLGTLPAVGGAPRVILRARAGQRIAFFSYAIGDAVAAVGLGARDATEADTNQSEAMETNDEDFAIEGLSATATAVRVDHDPVTFAAAFPGTSADFQEGIAEGIALTDPASVIVPPEIGSPLTLEQVLFQALTPHVTLQTRWNRKGGDHLGTLDQIPEGGGRSYLRANGEPTHHNFFRMPEGQIWGKEGSPQDSKFELVATLERDVWVLVTEPGIVQSADPQGSIGELEAVWLEWKMRAHGHAFYYPSTNV